jgi:hypothetical protein
MRMQTCRSAMVGLLVVPFASRAQVATLRPVLPAVPAAATAAPVSMLAVERVAPNTVSGFVIGLGGLPPDYARVVVDDSQAVSPDTSGRFTFAHVAVGPHRVVVVSIGYQELRGTFSVLSGTGTALVFRLNRAPVELQELCMVIVTPSVVVRTRAVPGEVIRIAHGDSVSRFMLDSLHDLPDAQGIRSVRVFGGAGKFEVSASAPGFWTWRKSVDAKAGWCTMETQTVDAFLDRQP